MYRPHIPQNDHQPFWSTENRKSMRNKFPCSSIKEDITNSLYLTGNYGEFQTDSNQIPTFFSRSAVWKVSRNFLTWSFLSWSMLRASMARPRNSSTSSSGFRASWAQRLRGRWNNRSLCGVCLCPCVSVYEGAGLCYDRQDDSELIWY